MAAPKSAYRAAVEDLRKVEALRDEWKRDLDRLLERLDRVLERIAWLQDPDNQQSPVEAEKIEKDFVWARDQFRSKQQEVDNINALITRIVTSIRQEWMNEVNAVVARGRR